MIIVGDVHGKYDQYYEIVRQHPQSIQIGDFGLHDTWNRLNISGLNSDNHKIIGGNHEAYDICTKSRYYLGDYGCIPTIKNSFFARGAYSIDQHHRTMGIDWFPEEELLASEMNEGLSLYRESKPEIVLSHDCPEQIMSFVHKTIFPNPTLTRQFLDAMMDTHQPDLWIFGHHHRSRRFIHRGCEFICLQELESAIL